jgi:hypothetical protein
MKKLLALVAAVTLMGSACADVLTATEVEKVSGLTGVHTVPKNQAMGAGGELNFVGADNKLVLMVMVQPQSTFEFWKNQYGAKGERVANLGSEAFRSKSGEFISYVAFLKGSTGVWVQSMGWKKGGGANFNAQQLEELARLAEPRV